MLEQFTGIARKADTQLLPCFVARQAASRWSTEASSMWTCWGALEGLDQATPFNCISSALLRIGSRRIILQGLPDTGSRQKIPYRKPSSLISVTEQRAESTSKGSIRFGSALLNQHRGYMVGMIGMVGICRDGPRLPLGFLWVFLGFLKKCLGFLSGFHQSCFRFL